MTAQWLLSWWNLIYIAPLLLALVYLGLYIATGLQFGDADADADAEVDADADADADADIDADVDTDADADVDGDADIDADANADVSADADADADTDADADSDADANGDSGAGGTASLGLSVLTWLGLGRVPVSLLLMVGLISWGAIGTLTNAIVQSAARRWMQPDGSVVGLSLPVALVGSALFTRGMALLISRYMPLNATSAKRRHALLGRVGEAIYPIDETFGMVFLRDEDGQVYQLACRVRPGAGAIAKGSHVQLLAYNAASNLFYVAQCPQTGERGKVSA